MLQIKLSFFFSALIFFIVNLDIQDRGVVAGPFGFFISRQACANRCRVRHGYFQDIDDGTLKQVSIGKVYWRIKCFCTVSSAFKKFVNKLFGRRAVILYGIWQRVGRGKAIRRGMAKKNKKVHFYTAKEYDEGRQQGGAGAGGHDMAGLGSAGFDSAAMGGAASQYDQYGPDFSQQYGDETLSKSQDVSQEYRPPSRTGVAQGAEGTAASTHHTDYYNQQAGSYDSGGMETYDPQYDAQHGEAAAYQE